MLDSLDTLIAFVLIMLVVSLLITIVVQMCSAFLNLRGLNLLKGLGKTFAVILPDVASVADTEEKEDAKKLASFILRGRLISDSSFIKHWPKWWRFATAARPDEIFDSIHRIATGQRSAPDGLKEAAQKVLTALGLNAGTLNDSLESARNLGVTVNKALEAVPDKDSRDAAQNALKEVSEKLIAFETDAVRIVTAAAGDIDAAYKKFQYWIDICQERVQQWFTLHTRLFTILFALVFAFLLQLDTVEIFKLVSNNKAVRDKLVAQATAVSSQAERTLGNSPTVLQSAYDTWVRDMKNANIKSALTSPSPPPVKIAATDTRESVARQIETALNNIKGKDDALKSFNDAVDTTVTEDLKKKSQDYREVQANFKETGFDLFPKNRQNTAFTRWGDSWQNGSWTHFWGILFSVGLLSLGAPFWYNALKNLASLRSTVAQNISKEQEQAQEQADLATPKPPPTLTPS